MNYFLCFWLAPVLLLAGPAVQAQAPAWQAAVALTTSNTGSAYANAVAADAQGNVYVAGQFSGTVSLGSFQLTSPAGAGNNGFVAKWNIATHSFSWVRQMGGAVSAVAVAGSSVYAAGSFTNTVTFGSTSLTSAGDYDIFVVKLTDTGSGNALAWVRQAGGIGEDRPQALAVGSAGVYVSGAFRTASTFGATTLTGNSTYTAFIAKLIDKGQAGDFAWAQAVQASNSDNATGLAVAGNAVYVAGVFVQSAQFGSITLTGGSGDTAYVARLTDAGATSSFSWAQIPATAASDMYALGVAVSGPHVYLVGAFTGTVAFGNQTLTAAGGHDVYVTRLTDGTTSAVFDWARQAGGPGEELGQKVAVVGSQLYITGSFRGTASFGSTVLASAGSGDVFVARLTDADSSASFGWAQSAGGPGNDGGYGLALSGSMPVVVGSFNATANFGSQDISSTSDFSENAFLALLGSDVLAATQNGTLPGVTLRPNPAHGTALLRLPNAATPATLTLLDALGRVVRTTTAPAGQDYTLDLTGFAPGVYVLRVQANGTEATRRLIIE